MISRLTVVAACFAILATASMAFASDLRQQASASQPKVVQLERVEITGKRLPQGSF